MEQGNALFYHQHILSHISRLNERKEGFVKHRTEFLREYCLPIQVRISDLRNEIDHYKLLLSQQNESIENSPEIKDLKQQIIEFLQTKEYYESHLLEYKEKAEQCSLYNTSLAAKIDKISEELEKQKNSEQGFCLPKIFKWGNTNNNKETLRKQVSSNLSKEVYSSRVIIEIDKEGSLKRNMSSQNGALPQIAIYSSKKEQRDRQSVQKEVQDPQLEQSRKSEQLKIRESMIHFDRTEGLFRECFDKKKQFVQKSVSQLQSKLIMHREEFLRVCQAVGSKSTAVPFEQFKKLTSDEIMTLFISFVWLNRRLNVEFVEKRKTILRVVGKLPRVP